MRYLGIQRKNEEYPVHYEVLSGLSQFSHEVEKTERRKVLQGKKSQKKTTSCNTGLCVT